MCQQVLRYRHMTIATYSSEIPLTTMDYSASDPRKPSPPFGYSRECHYTLAEQISIVALFHANRIKPGRIAYRVGIDLGLIEQLIEGHAHQAEFKQYLIEHRRNRHSQRMHESHKIIGAEQLELQAKIEADYQQAISEEWGRTSGVE